MAANRFGAVRIQLIEVLASPAGKTGVALLISEVTAGGPKLAKKGHA